MYFQLSWLVNHVISFVIWSVIHMTSFLEKMTSEVAFFLAGQSADALKAEKPVPVGSEGEYLL